MALHVTLVKTPEGVSLSKANHSFNQQGGTFGRADNNSWQLPDPDKFLSSCHCEIVWISGAYYLVDRSTNGTFLNDSPEPIGRGVKSHLNNGDIFEIGDYRFSVSIIENTATLSVDPFSSGKPSDSIFDSPYVSRPDFEGAPLFEQPLDPLAIWDKALKVPQPRSIPTVASFNANASLDDIFGNEPIHSQPDFAPVDLSQNMDQAMAWPEVSRENLIPADWEDDFSDLGLAPFSEMQIPSPGQLTDARIIPATQAMDVVVPKPYGNHLPFTERPAAIEPIISPSPRPIEPSTPPPTNPKVMPTALPVQQSTVSDADSTFIHALGLDAARLTETEIKELIVMSGQLMREITEGMMGVLRSRTSIKNEFRMNVTTIQPVENNPLKFSVSVDDALENMFLKKSNAYKKPIDAFREGFQEIAEHQIAMIGGIRQGFERMMERFNPENLEKNFSKQGRTGMIPGMQKAKCWNNYADYYAGFTDNMESSFQHLFGSDFVSAYEDQLRRLAAARKKDK